MPREIDLLDLGDEPYVSLTTFRKNGTGVPTTVWAACDGDALIVTTNEGTGKVKRLSNDPRVELRPSTRTGKVAPDAPVASGVAAVLRDDESRERLHLIFTAKYGIRFTVIMGVESRLMRNRGDRLVLRITAL